MEIIEKWLIEGCNYLDGVLIYKNIPKHNSKLLQSFERKQNSFNLEKLKHELKKFIVSANKDIFIAAIKKEVHHPKPMVNKVVAEKQKSKSNTAVLFHQLPEVLRPVLLEANQLFKENCLIKVSLNELAAHAEKESLVLQKKIFFNNQKNALCWKKIDYFLEHRIVAESPKSEFESLNAASLYRRQQLLYASISKLNTRLTANREKLKICDNVKTRSQIEKQIIKQEDNLLQQNEKLITISNLIDG